MNMQQMLQQVKKMQREYEKQHKILEETIFEGSANGVVKVYLKGDFTIDRIEILDDDILNKDDKDTLEESIKLAYQSAKDQIMSKEDELTAKFQKQPGGMLF